MPSRFPGHSNRGNGSEPNGDRGGGFGEWWAATAVIALVAMAIVSLMGSTDSGIEIPIDSAPQILESLESATRSLEAIESAFETLCQERVLIALELEPDCASGVITLPDDLFDGFGSAQLGSTAQQDVVAAMTTYLSSLRQLPAIWENLEAIEIRGHTDPRAVRDPYATNMVGSQQRALGVLLFLIGSDGLSEPDREELQRLAVVSGVSFARPPAACPTPNRECYPEWRRVEIRPVLDESLRRRDWSKTVQDVRRAALRAQRVGLDTR